MDHPSSSTTDPDSTTTINTTNKTRNTKTNTNRTTARGRTPRTTPRNRTKSTDDKEDNDNNEEEINLSSSDRIDNDNNNHILRTIMEDNISIAINNNTNDIHTDVNSGKDDGISDMGNSYSTTTPSVLSSEVITASLSMVENMNGNTEDTNNLTLPPTTSTSVSRNAKSTKETAKSTSSTANKETGGKDKNRRRKKVEAKWVQCEKTECNKWRKLPSHMSLDDLPQGKWYCEFNYWDPERAFCDAPEESWDANEVTIDPALIAPITSSTTPATNTGESTKKGKSNKGNQIYDAASNRSGTSTPIPSDHEDIMHNTENKSSTILDADQLAEKGNAFLNDEEDGPIYSNSRTTTNKRRRENAGGEDDTGTAKGKRRNRGNDTTVATPIASRKPTNPYVVTKPPLSSTGATLASMDRTNILPPFYVQGYRDYHNMMILHPIEVWADIGGGSGIFDQAIKGSWDQALSAGINASYSNSSAPRVAWNELIAKSWNNPSGNRNTTVIPSTVVTESHFRWNKSSMYDRPTIGSMQAHENINENTNNKNNNSMSAQDIARSGGKASVTKSSLNHKSLIPLVPLLTSPSVSASTSSSTSSTSIASLPSIAQIALSLYISSQYADKTSSTNESSPSLPSIPINLLKQLQQNLHQTSYPASSISTQPLRTSGPREVYYSSISHGIVMHTGVHVSPLDVIGASISESSQWSSASITLSQAITSMITRSLQQENKNRKLQRKKALRQQQTNTAGHNNNDDDEDNEFDDDDEDFSLEYFGNHKMNELGYLSYTL